MEIPPSRTSSDTQNRLLEFHGRNSYDPQGYHAFTENPDAMIIRLANDLSMMRSVQLRTIIDALADSSFSKKGKLLGPEVLAKLREHNIFGLIVDNFVVNLPDREMDVDDPSSPDSYCESAREDLAAFIANYARDPGTTLDSFIERWCRHVYPTVNFYYLFLRNPELRQKLAEQLEIAAKDIIGSKYHALFHKNPRQFILDFLFGRVIKTDKNGRTVADRDSIEKLVDFMMSEGANPEDIYMILYKEFMDMSEVKENILRTRAAVNAKLQEAVCRMDKYPFLHENFDFDEFFAEYFHPAICESRARHLPKVVRLTDIAAVTPDAMTTFLQPARALEPLLDKADLLQSGREEKMYQIRRFFNYLCTPQADLTDEEVEKILGEQLQKAAEQIQYTIDSGLKVRADAEIHRDCRFLPEIIGCRDVAKLFVWMARPRLFYREEGNGQYRTKVPPAIVAHQARKMLELLLMYRKFAFTEEYKLLNQNRVKWEEQFTRLLGLKNVRQIVLRFRIIEEIPEDRINGKKGENNGTYTVQFFRDGEEVPHASEFRYLRSNGRIIKYYPVEEKPWIIGEGIVPGKTRGAGTPATVMVYGGDGHIIHAKEGSSFFSSILRGKIPSDGLRAQIVEDEALHDWLTEDYADNVVVVRDNTEGRNIHNKETGKRKSAKSHEYSQQSDYKKAMYVTMPRKDDNGTVSHSHVKFEVQMDQLSLICVNTHSAYTRLSHETTYTPEREFNTLFTYFFPPVLYGAKMADYLLQGYDYNPNKHETILPTSSERGL